MSTMTITKPRHSTENDNPETHFKEKGPMTSETTKPKRKKLWIIIGIIAVVVAVVATLAVVMDQPVTPPAAPSGPNVIIWDGTFCNGPGNCGFSGNNKTVSVATTVTWTNKGGMPHTITTCDSNPPGSQFRAMNAASLERLAS